jgi:hypothetical protein
MVADVAVAAARRQLFEAGIRKQDAAWAVLHCGVATAQRLLTPSYRCTAVYYEQMPIRQANADNKQQVRQKNYRRISSPC